MLQELEQPVFPKKKKQVIDAIHSLGLRVSPSEVAEKSDLPILVAGQELNRLATECGAHLEVTASGSLVYAFDPRFEQAYAVAGSRRLFHRCATIFTNAALIVIRALALAGIFLLRVSFGLLLIASVVALVAVAVMAIIAVLKGGDDAGGDGLLDVGNLGNLGSVGDDAFASQWSLSFWCFDFLWDWIFFPRYLWRPYYGYGYGGWGYGGWGSNSYYDDYSLFGSGGSNSSYTEKVPIAKDDSSKKKEGKPRTKFLDSCFGLLFGSGNPNGTIERKRHNDIAAVIRSNQGVVVCEQLAPYVEGPKDNEDWMLPILLRFNGLPDVTETGHIIYLFPEFISTLAGTESTPQPSAASTTGTTGTTNTTSATNTTGTTNTTSATGTTSTTSSPGANPASNDPRSSDAEQLRALYVGHLNREKVIQKSVAAKADLERYLREENWELLPENGEYEAVYVFVGLAVALSLGLIYASGSVHVLHFLHSLFPLFYGILGYASLFVIFPMVRWVFNDHQNKAILLRNDRRLEASAKLHSPSADLQQKMDEARGIAISSLAEVDNRVVYTTREDFLEQQFEH